MSRNRHKSFSCHEREKYKKKCRVHRIKYEKGKGERDIIEKNIRKSFWSRWLNFIRGYLCGRIKNKTNPLEIYTRALSADVFDIPIEPKSAVTGTQMTVRKHSRIGLALSQNNSSYVSEKNECPHKKEDQRLMRFSANYHRAITGKNLPTQGLYLSESTDQAIENSEFVFPRSGRQNGQSRNFSQPSRSMLKRGSSKRKGRDPEHSCVQDINGTSSSLVGNKKAEFYRRRQVTAGINNLLDQLISFQQDRYPRNYKEPREKHKEEFDIESRINGQKRFLSRNFSRQVSPAILVNIKPFKKHISQSQLQENFPVTAPTKKLSSNQIKKTNRLEGNVGSQKEGIEKEGENIRIRSSMQRNQATSTKNLSRKETPTENPIVESSVNEDLCFVVGVYRSYNNACEESGEKSLDEVWENLDGRDHNIVFRKNMRQFRKKINKSMKGEERETVKKEPKPKKEPEARVKMEKLRASLLMRSGVILGMQYNLVTEYNILRTVSIRKEIHTVTISQTVREIYQFQESCFRTVIQERFPNVAKQFLIREIQEIPVSELKKARIWHELKYCLRNIKGVARVMISPKRKASTIFCIARDYSTPRRLEPVQSQDNITDLLGFLQEYSELVEKSYPGDDLNEIEKILSMVAKSFAEIETETETDSDSQGSSINTNVKVQNLAEDHRVVQILNSSALEYLALIYQTLRPRSCSGKSSSEGDLYRKRKQAITLNSEINVMKDFDGKEFRQRAFAPTSSVDCSQFPTNDMESCSDEGDENLFGMGTVNILDSKKKGDVSIASTGGRKMLMFKSNSFPCEIATMRDYRAQRSRLFKDLHKDFEKKRKSTEKGLDLSKGGNSHCLIPEKPMKTESDSTKISKFQKYLVPDQLKSVKENGNKQMFFIEKNAGELKKEVIAAFSTIKNLTEEKDNAKRSVVIMLSRK